MIIRRDLGTIDVAAVIFDMDGVIMNSEPFHMQVELDLLHELNVPEDKKTFQRFTGTTARHMWETTIKEYNLSVTVEAMLKRAEQNKYEQFDRWIKGPIEGIPELLELLQSTSIPCGVASSSPLDYVKFVMNKLALTSYFETMTGGNEIQNPKPAPDIFQLAAKRLNVDLSQCIVIEDSTHGVNGAKAAGAYCIAFDNPSSPGQDHSKADAVARSHEEIRNYIQQHI